VTAELRSTAGSKPAQPRKGVAANSRWQLLAFAFRAVAGLGVVVLLARLGGPRALGVVQFALTLSSLLPFYYGLPSLLAREVARRPEEARRWVEAGTLVALSFGGLFLAALPTGAWLVGAAPETVLAIGIATFGMVFDGLARVQFAGFWAWERLDLEAKITGVQEAVYLAGAAAALALGGGPLAVLWVFTGSRAVGALGGWALIGRRLGGLPLPRAGRRGLRRTVRQCTPFAISDTLTLTYMRIDSVLLGVWKGPAAVGLYQAATNLVLYFNVISRSINRALYPWMGRAWPGRPEEFGRLRDLSMRVIAFLAVPITVGSLLLAPRTIDFLYGPEFAPAVLTYQLLVIIIPVRMVGNTLSLSLAATDRQTWRSIAVTVAAVANIGLNLYLIPRYSYLGAAIATVISETGLLFAYAFLMRRAAGRSELLRANGWPLLAVVPMAAVILATSGTHMLVSAVLGFAAYGAAVAVLALLRSCEQPFSPGRALTRLVRPRR
jgi:O-antigen/teichoic acid export membrane protein